MNRGFRIYDKVEKKMIVNPTEVGIFLAGNGNLIKPDYPELYLMDRYVRMDFAGLLDKQGKKIYEGDILVTTLPISTAKLTRIVEWDDSAACYILWDGNAESEQSRLMSGVASHSEIVGDIYSNPELLERPK